MPALIVTPHLSDALRSNVNPDLGSPAIPSEWSGPLGGAAPGEEP
jgi:hypothetical protein